jgi:hypothetical protein
MRAWVLGGVAAVVCSFGGAACGAARSPRSSSTNSSRTSSSSTKTARTSTSRTRTASASSAAGTSGSSTAGPGQAHKLLMEAATALRRAHGYAMRGAIGDGRLRLRLEAATSSNGSVEIAVTIGPASEQLIFVKSAAYVRANEYYWRSQATTRTRAPALANRWIAVPPSGADALAASFGVFSPPNLARCLVEDHGSLSIATGSPLAGKRTVVVKDAGNAPGASPGSLIIAAQGPRYPLRLSSTGDTRPGGRIDVCNDGKGGNARGTIAFSQFGKVPAIRAPRDPLRVSGQLGI